jgi:hypothetical protein
MSNEEKPTPKPEEVDTEQLTDEQLADVSGGAAPTAPPAKSSDDWESRV